MVKVLLVDDHAMIRDGIRAMLAKVEDIEVVGEAGDGESAVELAEQLQPDVVMMDLDMKGIGGLEATRRILRCRRKTRIIILSVHMTDPYPNQALEVGALGYISKNCGMQQLEEAIHTVCRGELYLEAGIARDIIEKKYMGKSSLFDNLSQREMQVMLMITRGYSISEVSDQLCLSPKTISTYRYRLYSKLGVNNDVELTRLAIRHKVIDTEDHAH